VFRVKNQCVSCKKEVTTDYVKFKCPGCGKEIVRCYSCREISAPFACACGFAGP
jgi:hypothetical protein